MRLDVYLVSQDLVASREKAQLALSRSYVLVNGAVKTKASYTVQDSDLITLLRAPVDYVGLGGEKLEIAHRFFGFETKGVYAADLGSSTGGFTDFLLQHGAEGVLCVDVGKDQLHPSLRIRPEVSILEETDIRDLYKLLPETKPISLLVMDLSFISITKVMHSITEWVKLSPYFSHIVSLICLVKPQFESNVRSRARGGIVRDDRIRNKAVDDVQTCAEQFGWKFKGITSTEADGKSKNLEFLMHLIYEKSEAPSKK